MPLRTCIVRYHDQPFTRSIEVVAETLYEAAVLGIRAMEIQPETMNRIKLDISVKEPEVWHSISGAQLNALDRTARQEPERADLEGAARGADEERTPIDFIAPPHASKPAKANKRTLSGWRFQKVIASDGE